MFLIRYNWTQQVHTHPLPTHSPTRPLTHSLTHSPNAYSLTHSLPLFNLVRGTGSRSPREARRRTRHCRFYGIFFELIPPESPLVRWRLRWHFDLELDRCARR